MGIEQSYIFSNEANFTKNNTAIEDSKGKLQFVDNPSQIFTQNFDNDVDFDYDDTVSEFSGGRVQHTDQRPDNAVLAHTFNQTTNPYLVNWSTNTLTTVNNGVTFVSGKARSVGDQSIVHSGIIPITGGVGAVRMKITALASGNPTGLQRIFRLQESVSSEKGLLELRRDTASAWRFAGKRADGSSYTSNLGFNTTTLTIGQTIELLFAWDFPNGKITLFADGSRTTIYSTTPTYLTSYGYLVFFGLAGNNLEFDDIVVYNGLPEELESINDASYTIGYSLPETKHYQAIVDMPPFVYSGIGSIQSIDAVTLLASSLARLITGGYWFSGGEWIESDGTEAESNSLTEFEDNVINFPAEGGGSVTMRIILPAGNVQQYFDLFSIEMTGQKRALTGYFEPVIPIESREILDYDDDILEPTNTLIRRVLRIDNVLNWFNTVSEIWEESDGTTEQGNTKEEIQSHLAELTQQLGANSTIYPRWLLKTTDENVTPYIVSSFIDFNFGRVETQPDTVIIDGYVRRINGNPLVGAKLRFELYLSNSAYYKEANKNIVSTLYEEVVTDENGYFTTPLIRSSEFVAGTQYKVTIFYEDEATGQSITVEKGSAGKLLFTAPDAISKDISDLLPAVTA